MAAAVDQSDIPLPQQPPYFPGRLLIDGRAARTRTTKYGKTLEHGCIVTDGCRCQSILRSFVSGRTIKATIAEARAIPTGYQRPAKMLPS